MQNISCGQDYCWPGGDGAGEEEERGLWPAKRSTRTKSNNSTPVTPFNVCAMY